MAVGRNIMLGRMRFEIDGNDLHTQSGSRLHGFIMEQLNAQDASAFHQSQLQPFSQSVYTEHKKKIWEISSLNKHTWDILNEKLNPLQSIVLNNGEEYAIVKKDYSTIEKDEFIKKYFTLKSPNPYINLKFVTPTAFKSYGKYINYPDKRLIIQSLLKKFNAFQTDYNFISGKLLEDIEEQVILDGYKVQSNKFSLEGIKIPSFQGFITLKVYGSDILKSYLHLLVAFGEFSGIGIKSALGMGKIRKIGGEEWTRKN